MDAIDRIIALRHDADETQRDLSKIIGFHYVQIANYETRKNEFPVRYLLAICQRYGVSADYILGLPKNGKWPR